MLSFSTPARLCAALADTNLVRIGVSFWLFGLINNIIYVILLSAALDLVGPATPKATVLLASIVPGLATKAVVPYVYHLVPYSLRVVLFVALSTSGMLAVALSPSDAETKSIAAKMAGIVLANIASGAGEVNFLSLTHYYGSVSLAAWSSGTGGAGLVGAGAYALATNTFGFSAHATLLASAVLPAGMIISFFIVLPRGALKAGLASRPHDQLPASQPPNDDSEDNIPETEGLLNSPPEPHPISSPHKHNETPFCQRLWHDLLSRLRRTRSLVIPYMLPLFLVYLAEYTINQGVAPTLLFPLSSSPFKHYRAFYPAYGALYQAGVFISRSSLPIIRIRALYTPTLLQILNLILLTAHSLHPFLPSVWFVFALIFWEGLLGGLVYVSAFAAVREDVPASVREFSLGAVTVSDSAGIFVAGLLGAIMEPALCSWQVRHGRDWCRRL